MYLALLAGVAGFAALSHAILIPPTLSPDDAFTRSSTKLVPVEHTFEIQSRSFIIDCPGCYVAVPNAGGIQYDVANLHSRLFMNFSIAHDGGIDRLLLNDVHLYPNDPSMATFFDPITAPQMISGLNTVAEPKIGYRMRIHRPPTSNHELDLVVLEFQIIEVGGRFVQGMSDFVIKLLETPSEKLMIGDITYGAHQQKHLVPGEGKGCHSTLCRWKETISGKISGAKGCGGKPGRPHHLNHDEHSSHRNHGHHGHMRHVFIRFVRGIALHVLIPIAIGIVVGMTASMVGFVAATFIVFLWRLIFRRNRPAAYAQVPQEEIATEESEKSKIDFREEEHIDAPPVYEEVVEPKA